MKLQTITTTHLYPIRLDIYQPHKTHKQSEFADWRQLLTMISTYVTMARSKYDDIRAQLSPFCSFYGTWIVFDAGNRAQMSLAFKKETQNPPANLAHAEEVFSEHGDFVRRIIRFHVRNQVEGEDLFQDFFLELISRPIPENVQNVRGYIYHVVCDNIKDAFRRIERYQKRLRRYAEHRERIIENRLKNDPRETEEAEKMFELIRKYLPKKEASAITLRYYHNYDTAKVAKTMGIEPRSASRYISAATKKLRQAIGINEGYRHDNV